MQKNVLVTGASTGIGYDCVRILIENKFTVVATVRKESDKINLEKNFGPSVKVLIVDVNNYTEVEKIPLQLKNEFNITSLNGLVNNAGVALAGPFMYQDFFEVQNIIQTNVLSVMKMTQVLLPMLQTGLNKATARIINISSVSGLSALPFLSIYAASKHAIEGFSNALRQELKFKNIDVCIVGPGSIKTPIWQKGFQVIEQKYNQTEYKESFEQFMKLVEAEIEHALPVSEVSDCVLNAMTSVKPKKRYSPVPRKFRNTFLPYFMPASWLEKLTMKVLKLG